MAKAAVHVNAVQVPSAGNVEVGMRVITDTGLDFSTSLLVAFTNSISQMNGALRAHAKAQIQAQGGPVLNENNDIFLFGAAG